MDDNKLKQFLLSNENIVFSIHTVQSYIQNRALLENGDKKLLYELNDIYNVKIISKVINSVKEKLEKILEDDSYFFSASVFFKPKKYHNENGNINPEYRPIHMTDLISQISIIALLHVLIYKFDDNMRLSLSELTQLIPENFYGNKISTNGNSLFKYWTKQYSEYNTIVNELVKEYKETNEYKYIVTLDLKNFFPSVSHETMCNYLLQSLPVYHNDSDLSLLKKIIKKLVYIEIGNYSQLNSFEKQQYTQNEKNDENENITWCIGIPQGLPHSYIFANFIMIKISEIYKSFFKGPMYFYVDDSTIFTNEKLEGNFTKIINDINKELKKQFNNSDSNNLCKGIEKNSADNIILYNIAVHKNGKSYFEEIKDMKIDYAALARETSKVSFDMYSTFSDDENQALYNRYTMILSKVEKELNGIKDDNNKNVQVKKLTQYKKFYKYRMLILEAMLEKNFDKSISIIKEHVDAGSDCAYFFETYTDDATIALLNYILRNLPLNKQKEYIYLIDKIINYLCADKIDKNHLTIYKEFGLDTILDNKEDTTIIDYSNKTNRYSTLDLVIRNTFKVFNNTAWENKLSYIKNELMPKIYEDISNNFQSIEIYNFINHADMRAYSKIIDINDNNIYRYVLNALFSYLFNIPTSDKFIFNKYEHRLISYFELRILSMIRNKKTSIKSFLNFINRLVEDNEQENIDYLLLEVMDRFSVFVSNPEQIDNLILIHKFCSDTWKNGSKYLNFYTMHNQEHAVSLIKNINTITKKISELKINQNEAFILFASCYLHDISMVTVPNLVDIIKDKDSKDQIEKDYNSIFNNINVEHKEQSGSDNYKINELIKIHNKIYDIIANYVRKTHPETSAIEICKHNELNFLSNECRQLIACISLSHGEDTKNIYGFDLDDKKSKIKDNSQKSRLIFDEQKIKIMLRIADLLDINRYRISKVVFNHNLDKFNDITKFHWISHLLTENSDINVSYENPADVSKKLEETIDFIVYVNFNQKTKLDIRCTNDKYISDVVVNENDIIYSFNGCNNNKCENNCNIFCYWFTLKNDYLVQEVTYLQQYLKQKNVFYDTSLKIKVIYTKNSNVADSNILSHLIEYVKNDSSKKNLK